MWYGFFKVRHYDKNGRLCRVEEIPNNLAQEGQHDILDLFFRGGSSPKGFEVALFDDVPQPSDKIADLIGEPVGNDYFRPLLERGKRGWPVLSIEDGIYRIISSTVTFKALGGSWGPVRSIVLIAKGLEPPANLTVTPQAVGSTRWSYAVTAVAPNGGETLPCPATEITNGAAVLDETNYNILSWDPVPGAVQYKVYRLNEGCIGVVDTNSFIDDGAPGDGSPLPTSDTSGRHISFALLSSPLVLNDREVFDVAYKVRLKSI